MIKIIAFGKIKNPYINNLIIDYINRIKHYSKIESIEIKDSNIEGEAKKIEEKIETNNKKNKESNVFLLCEEGRELNSIEFSNLLKEDAIFVIGGPFGLSEKIKTKYRKISLSKMTFPHEIARLVLLEQIYRGFTIIKNLPYHK